MMRLYLVRHGDAVPEHLDPDRPLSERGRREVQTVAEFLARAGIGDAEIRHSTKTRARQTAEIIAAAAGGIDVREREGLLPLDPVGDVAEAMANEMSNTIIVGHLPFLGKLVSLLVTGDESAMNLAFAPAGVVCLAGDAEDDWSMAWMVTPEVLAAEG